MAMAGCAAAVTGGAQAKGAAIQLHVDLTVDPSKEQEMLPNFRKVFQPAIRKQPGFVDVKLLKLHSTLAGSAPAGVNYRLLIAFASEADRQKWIATDLHNKTAWPSIENTLKTKSYNVLLFDVA